MDIQKIHLDPRQATVDFLVGSQSRHRVLSYVKVPEFREMVTQTLQSIAEMQQRDLFGNVCGRCGNSCRREKILVREQEILALQSHFGLDEKAFRQRHLEPAHTWNPGDALLRHESGACPFLSSDGSDNPLNASCLVHDIRPQSCRDFRSNASVCRKDLGVTLEELATVTLTPTQTSALLSDGTVGTWATDAQGWENLCQAFAATELSDPDRFEKTAQAIIDVLQKMIHDFPAATVDQFYREILASVEELIRTAASMLDMRPEVDTSVSTMWDHYHEIEALIARRERGEPANPESVARPQGLEWMILGESALALKVLGHDQPYQLTLEPFLDSARQLMERILRRPDDELQYYVRKDEPECLICGECCKAYEVEILPSDVHRLCALLRVTYADFVENYSRPARFGWNPHDRIMNKKTVPRYSKRLMDLRVIGGQTDEMCQFLERRDHGFYFCRVYTHRPYVCRAYQPTNALCLKTNQRENWGRQAQNVRSVLMTSDAFFIQSTDTTTPRRFSRMYWPEVDEAARTLEAAAVQQAESRRQVR